MNIGMNETIGTVDSSPMSPAPQPHWNTMTMHAVGRADAQQVEQRGLERHEHRPEDQHQQQERQQDHRGDEQRQPVVDPVADVGEVRRLTADVGPRRAARRARAGARRPAAARPSSCVASSCGPVVGDGDQRRDAGVGVHLAGAHRGDARGRRATASRSGSTTLGSPAMSTAMTSGPLLPGPKPCGDQVVGPALGPGLGQRALVGDAQRAGRAPARRARAAATVTPTA